MSAGLQASPLIQHFWDSRSLLLRECCFEVQLILGRACFILKLLWLYTYKFKFQAGRGLPGILDTQESAKHKIFHAITPMPSFPLELAWFAFLCSLQKP